MVIGSINQSLHRVRQNWAFFIIHRMFIGESKLLTVVTGGGGGLYSRSLFLDNYSLINVSSLRSEIELKYKYE